MSKRGGGRGGAAAVAAEEADTENMSVSDLWNLMKPELDNLQKTVKSNFDSLTSSIDNLKQEVNDRVDGVEGRVGLLEVEVADLRKLVKTQSIDLNFRGQRERKNGMRLNAYFLDKEILEDGDKLQSTIFDDVLKPMFDAAVKDVACRLDKVPTFLEAIDALHVLPLFEPKNKKPVGAGAKPAPQTPSIHIKFRSSEFKRIVCAYKKDVLADINKDGGEAHLIDDKTPANARCMALLRADKTVDPMSVQLRNCRIKFNKLGSKVRHTVKNPFGNTLDEFI